MCEDFLHFSSGFIHVKHCPPYYLYTFVLGPEVRIHLLIQFLALHLLVTIPSGPVDM